MVWRTGPELVQDCGQTGMADRETKAAREKSIYRSGQILYREYLTKQNCSKNCLFLLML